MTRFFSKDITRTAADVVAAVREEIAILNANPGAGGLKTGIKSLDRVMKHGFAFGLFGLVAGGTGSGKTVIANQLALAFSSQTWVQIFTLEDNAEQTMKRNIANIARIDVGEIRSAFDGKHIPKTFDDAMTYVESNTNLGFVDKVHLDVLDVFNLIFRHWNDTRKRCSGVVIVDQLSMLGPVIFDDEVRKFCDYFKLPYPPGPRAREDQHLAWAGKVLEIAAQKMNLLVIAISQLNASKGVSEEPDEHSLAASKALAHHASFVLIPWVPRKIRKENPAAGKGEPRFTEYDNLLGEAYWIGTKNRNGERFKERATFLGKYQVFVDFGDEGLPFTLPAPRSESAIKAMAKLTALRSRLSTESDERLREATVVEAPKQRREISNESPADEYVPTDEDLEGAHA